MPVGGNNWMPVDTSTALGELVDLSYDQIADAMSLASTGTVKSRVWTAMQRLKHCMGMSQGKEEVCDV